MSQSLFNQIIYFQSSPLNNLCPVKRMKKITPTLKMSHFSEQKASPSLYLNISGATYPGVPHLLNIQFFRSKKVANPKSAITNSDIEEEHFSRMLSGLRSRWMIYLECICSTAANKLPKHFPICFSSNLCWFIFYNNSPPFTNCNTKYKLFSVSYISYNFKMLLLSNPLRRYISFMNDSFPFS